MTNAATVSLVVPTFNECDNIEPLLSALVPALEGWDWEILFVDDDSQDGTGEKVREAMGREPRVRLIVRRGERGLAGAVVRGFSEATGIILGSINADLSHDAATIPAMIRRIEAGAEMVVASRRIPGGGFSEWPWYRKLASDVATVLARRMLSTELSDPMSGFYFLRRSVFERARDELQTSGFKVMLNLVVVAHPRPLCEEPYIFKNRRHGSTKVSLGVAAEYLRMLWRLRRRRRAKQTPVAPVEAPLSREEIVN